MRRDGFRFVLAARTSPVTPYLARKVEETGLCGKAQRELERKLEELSKQPVNVERVSEDVKLVQAEIDALEQKLGLVKVR